MRRLCIKVTLSLQLSWIICNFLFALSKKCDSFVLKEMKIATGILVSKKYTSNNKSGSRRHKQGAGLTMQVGWVKGCACFNCQYFCISHKQN